VARIHRLHREVAQLLQRAGEPRKRRLVQRLRRRDARAHGCRSDRHHRTLAHAVDRFAAHHRHGHLVAQRSQTKTARIGAHQRRFHQIAAWLHLHLLHHAVIQDVHLLRVQRQLQSLASRLEQRQADGTHQREFLAAPRHLQALLRAALGLEPLAATHGGLRQHHLLVDAASAG
jgi:hypothetical protein